MTPPSWLPRYDLGMDFCLDEHLVRVRERVTWINRHQRPATELVFNAHAHYKIPDKDVGLLAKMLEILRVNPGEALDFEGHCCEVTKVLLLKPRTTETEGHRGSGPLEYHYREDNDTALVIPLPRPVEHGEVVSIEIEFTMHLPQKQGRWGQWKGVTFLSNWLPVLAYYDNCGWQPTPFIPWHQPFFNEAGHYHAIVTLPCEQKVACTGSIVGHQASHGRQRLEIMAEAARDFAFLCSERYCEQSAQAGPVRIRCLAFPEHEHYAHEMLRAAAEALPVYSQWFGPFPYPEFTIAESYFGWNGNECGGLIMIDERIFAMPHFAQAYADYLVSHETCHQWWYNTIGTNGYCETWMDEGLATYFSHRLLNGKCGKRNKIFHFPKGLEWLPNIDRDTYRIYGFYGTLGRGECGPVIQEMPKFEHLVTLSSLCYDKGSKIVGMIEERLGEAAFFDFMRRIYSKYYFDILRVADFQRELEEYTGQSWDEFFQHWLYGAGNTDWCLQKVKIVRCPSSVVAQGSDVVAQDSDPEGRTSQDRNPELQPRTTDHGCYKVTVLLHQKGEYNEQTVLGFCLEDGDAYQVRVPILPQVPHLEIDTPPAKVDVLPDNHVRVEVLLPRKPTQVSVDPDQVLVDCNPANNHWKAKMGCRFTPLYTQLDETDLTTAYDRWNFIAGPWLYDVAYSDPWYTRSTMAGFRAGLYRTQVFDGGVYLAYRTNDRNIVAGLDGLWDHWPWCHTQIGFNAERSLVTPFDDEHSDRGVIFARYVIDYSSSLYLPPMHYVEAFAAIQNNFFPVPRLTAPLADHFDHTTELGLHYHIDYLTPYWDPEGGFRFDAAYSHGLPVFGEREDFNKCFAQFSMVQGMPDGLGWLSETRLAFRLYGGAGLPDKGQFFALGGGELFRGFDVKERQGNAVWLGSLEWRVPLARGLTWDYCDHVMGVRNIYAAAFYDVGDVFLKGHELGHVAHAVGGGIRLDVAWLSFLERTILRLDIAQTLSSHSPVQFWIGISHPF